MRHRYEVRYVHRSAYEGIDPQMPEKPYELPRTQHRTYFGADFYRRFRFRPMTMGHRWVETSIVRPEGKRHIKPGRVMLLWEQWGWGALYWLRSRWDGLRYGLDRDKR